MMPAGYPRPGMPAMGGGMPAPGGIGYPTGAPGIPGVRPAAPGMPTMNHAFPQHTTGTHAPAVAAPVGFAPRPGVPVPGAVTAGSGAMPMSGSMPRPAGMHATPATMTAPTHGFPTHHAAPTAMSAFPSSGPSGAAPRPGMPAMGGPTPARPAGPTAGLPPHTTAHTAPTPATGMSAPSYHPATSAPHPSMGVAGGMPGGPRPAVGMPGPRPGLTAPTAAPYTNGPPATSAPSMPAPVGGAPRPGFPGPGVPGPVAGAGPMGGPRPGAYPAGVRPPTGMAMGPPTGMSGPPTGMSGPPGMHPTTAAPTMPGMPPTAGFSGHPAPGPFPGARPPMGGPPTTAAPPTMGSSHPPMPMPGPRPVAGPPSMGQPAVGAPPGGMAPPRGPPGAGIHSTGMAPGGPMGSVGMMPPRGPGAFPSHPQVPGSVSRGPAFGAPHMEEPGRPAPGMFVPSPSMGAPSGPSPMGGMPASAPSAQLPPPEINEHFQCRPAYMALTVGAIPANSSLQKRAALPFGLCVHPLAEGEGSMGTNGIPVVNFGAAGVIRCKQCRAYINPFSKFVDGGHRWKCNFCAFANDVPAPYFSPLNPDGSRVDVMDRAELSNGSVEFVAPAEYMVRPPQPPVFVFVIDVSYNSFANGILQASCEAILQSLDTLPGEDRAQIGIVTFDNTVHFYNLRPSLKAPQMIVVPDISDLFLPIPEELLANLSESRHLVETLLRSLPTMFASARSPESALGPALDAAFQMMQHIGGKMVVIQASLPTMGSGKLKLRENQKMLGSEQEHTLLAPDSGDGGAFYKGKAVDFSRQQICVDMFLFAQPYADVATLGALSRYTAGQVYFYPNYNGSIDGARYVSDLSRNLTRTTGFEAVMRIRATKGLAITNFYGNFFIRGNDLLALPNVTCDTAFNVELTTQDGLQPNSVIAIQAALLYTTSSGERRINVHTLCKPVTAVLTDLFRNVSVDAVANMMSKIALDHALRTGFSAARVYLQKAVVDVIRAYRAATTAPAMMPGGPRGPAPGAGGDISTMLPENLMLLPLYTLGMQKCTLYRGGDTIRSDERASLVYRMLTMPIPATQSYIYPRLYSLHDMPDNAGRPDPTSAMLDPAELPVVLPPVVNLTAARLATEGIFLLDSGIELYLWCGRSVNPQLLNALFGATTLEGIDMQLVAVPEMASDFNQRVRSIIRTLQSRQCQYQKVRCVREGANDLNEMRFAWHLVEDRQNFRGGGVTYAEFIPQIFSESQRAQIGGTEPVPSG